MKEFKTLAEGLAALEKQYRNQRCFAEIGKPGSFHGCPRRWAVKKETKSGTSLYCKRHGAEGSI